MDTGDSGSGKERTAVAKAAVIQGSVVMRARLVRVAVEARVTQGLAMALVTLRRLRRGGDDMNEKPTPSSLFISQKGVAEESLPPTFAIIANSGQTCFTT